MKKMLVLGGKPIGSKEIVEAAKSRGIYTIVTDYLKKDDSPAKQIADETWDISTAEIEKLTKKIKEKSVSAVITGVHEFNIERKIELCDLNDLPQYCTKEQWNICENKRSFKALCEKFDIEVAKTYTQNDAESGNIEYPVIVKPVDSSGSRGFSICNNLAQLKDGIKLAKEFSNECLIEEYVEHEACIIHYTAINGKIIFSGMSDKHSQVIEGGASVMALQTFPSAEINMYLNEINSKAIKMFESLKIKNGPIWIEAFNDINKKRFLFNEMGYRLGGSMTNYPVKHFYGIDQLDLIISNAIGEKFEYNPEEKWIAPTKNYCILPIHIRAGKVKTIDGLKQAREMKKVNAIVLVHDVGDDIQNWGTAQQVFCYLHIKYDDKKELLQIIDEVKEVLHVKDENDKDMLFYLFDLSKLNK